MRPFPRGPPQQAAPSDVSIKKKKSGKGSKQKLETSGSALSYLKNSPVSNSTRNLVLAFSLCDSHAHQSVEPMGDATFMEGLGKV